MRGIKTAIGLMSGTSMDGIDAALLKSDGENNIDVVDHYSCEYDGAFQQLLKSTLDEVKRLRSRSNLNATTRKVEQELTLRHVAVVNKLLTKCGVTADGVDLIGFHGQTVLHKPEIGLTIQIGDGELLADKTGIDVIFDLRANDMKHGGQGAPLVPVYHHALANRMKGKFIFPIAFINIGGISNLTFVNKNEELYAFDCGPGNALIDQWMFLKTKKNFDTGGEAGLNGKLIQHIIRSYSHHPFFQQQKPGSLDWRSFKPFVDETFSVEDGAASLSYVTAFGIVNSFRHLPVVPKTLIVSGGGAHNGAILKYLKELTSEYRTVTLTAQSVGLNSDFLEAEAWGYLAIRSFYDMPITFPTTTGCDSPQSGGVFVSHHIDHENNKKAI